LDISPAISNRLIDCTMIITKEGVTMTLPAAAQIGHA
jgi:hypothetical protein